MTSPTEIETKWQGAYQTGLRQRQVGQIVSMVDELLDVSRIRRGHIGMDRQRLDLVDIVHQALEVAEPAMRQRGHIVGHFICRHGCDGRDQYFIGRRNSRTPIGAAAL